MNILLFVSSMGKGGAERVASTLVNAWVERGDVVTLVATYSGRGACDYPLTRNVRLLYLSDVVGRRGRNALTFLARWKAMRNLIRKEKPDVVVSFLTNVNIATILVSQYLDVPKIACERTNPLADGRSALVRLLCRIAYPKADLITLLSNDTVEPFRRAVPGMKDVAVIPSPLPHALLPYRRRVKAGNERQRLISVGRLHESKQFGLLIDIFSSLAEDFPDWDLWIWGEGPLRHRLEAQVAEAGMTGRIFLPGVTSVPWEEMAAAQAFVLSSRFEGLPMALMESMAVGLPCVAFDCPSGPRELTCNGRDGLLVSNGDAVAMKLALRRLLGSEALRVELGQRAAAAVRERYSLSNVLTIWDDLFRRVGARA